MFYLVSCSRLICLSISFIAYTMHCLLYHAASSGSTSVDNTLKTSPVLSRISSSTRRWSTSSNWWCLAASHNCWRCTPHKCSVLVSLLLLLLLQLLKLLPLIPLFTRLQIRNKLHFTISYLLTICYCQLWFIVQFQWYHFNISVACVTQVRLDATPSICIPLQYGSHICTHTLKQECWQTVVTLSTPAVPNCCCLKGPAPYWSNPPFLIFDIRELWCSVLSIRLRKCQKLKTVG